MKRYRRSLLVLALTCLGAANSQALVIRHPDNGRYLYETQTASNLLLSGFGSIVFATPRNFVDDINGFRANHIRYARMWTLAYDAEAGLAPWIIGSGPFQTGGVRWGWNDVYWQRFGEALDAAYGSVLRPEETVYVEIMLFDRSDSDCNGWNMWVSSAFPCESFRDPGHPWRALQEAWVAKILTESGAFRNVFFEIENEPEQRLGVFINQQRDWHLYWANFIRLRRPLALIAINPPTEPTDVIPELASWDLSQIDVLNLHPTFAQEDDPETLAGVIAAFGEHGKVVSMDEFGNCRVPDRACEVEEVDFNMIRRAAWTALGSAAHFHIEDIIDGHSDPTLVADLIENIEVFKRSWRFWRFNPSSEAEVESGGGPIARFCTRGEFAGDRREYMCYLPQVPQGTDQVIVTLPPPTPFEGWRLRAWNPRNPDDVYEVPPYFSESPTRIVVDLPAGTPNPMRRDWVLHVDVDDRPRHDLTVSRTGIGSGTVRSDPPGIDCGTDCAGRFVEGTEVTLTATAAAGSLFLGWSGSCTGTGPCQVTMGASLSVSARFEPAHVLTVVRTGGGSGRVDGPGISCGTDCSETYLHGTVVTLTATAGSDSTFEGWSGGGCSGVGPCQVTMVAATTVTARFELRRYLFTVTRLGSGTGTVTSTPAGIDCGSDCQEMYPHYQLVRLRAAPASGSTFVRWGGSCSGTQSTCDVVVDEAEAVTATFEPPTPSATLQYYPLTTPCRVLDTRPGVPLVHGVQRGFKIAGTCVPFAAQSVAATLIAVAPTGAGSISINGGPLTLTSVANFPLAGGAWASSMVSSLTPEGHLFALAAVIGGGSTHLVIDVTGYFGAPGPGGQDFTPLATPTRMFDAALVAGQERIITLGGPGFPAATPSAVAVSVAAVDPPAAGHVSVYPPGAGSGGTSTLNYAPASRLYNGAVVRVVPAPAARVAAVSSQSHRLLVDVNGVFHEPANGALRYHPITPCRVLDTRVSGGRFAAGESRSFQVRGMCGAIPDGARAVAANFAVVGPDAWGHLAFRPTGGPLPTGGHLLYAAGWTIGSGALLPLSASPAPAGDLTVFSVAGTHLLVDVTGYFSAP